MTDIYHFNRFRYKERVIAACQNSVVKRNLIQRNQRFRGKITLIVYLSSFPLSCLIIPHSLQSVNYI